jgi:hypothetical protein
VTVPVASAHPVVMAIGETAAATMVGALADVQVLDGVDPLQAYASKSLTIGGTWDPDLAAFTTEQVVSVEMSESGAGRRPVESVAVRCIAYAGSGDKNFALHRSSVMEILTAFGAALRALTVVDGVSARLWISDQQWAQGTDDKGSLVMAMFTASAVLLP